VRQQHPGPGDTLHFVGHSKINAPLKAGSAPNTDVPDTGLAPDTGLPTPPVGCAACDAQPVTKTKNAINAVSRNVMMHALSSCARIRNEVSD
jgi:hypothetical protein